MATNPPLWDNKRIWAVKKRSQVKNPKNKRFVKIDEDTKLFLNVKADKKKFKWVRIKKKKADKK